MTRKLHNTLMAVIASSSLLAIGLIAGAPVVPDMDASTSTDVLVSIAADQRMFSEVLPDTAAQPEALPSGPSRATRHSRQALAMPFYSFAPRG